MKAIEIIGRSISEAVEEGAAKLGVGLSEVEYTVVDEGSKGFLGLGARPSKVRVYLPGFENELDEMPAEPKKEETPAKETVKEVKKEAKKAAKEAKKEAKAAKREDEKQENAKEEAPAEAAEEQEEKPERPPLSDEDKAVIIKMAEDFLKELFGAMKLEVELNSEFIDNKQLIVNMNGPEMGVIIGKRGQTLDSIQTLTSLVVNKSEYPYINVTLDTESYRERRKETLERLAFNLAKKCKHNRRNVVLEPMNPYERRIIHSTLQNDRYVTTYSEGIEPHRYVVITMKNSYGKQRENNNQ
ncbi:MAG: protein jag [Firmicutes bacterium]|nr:protein jag [Bacillota bacterium]